MVAFCCFFSPIFSAQNPHLPSFLPSFFPSFHQFSLHLTDISHPPAPAGHRDSQRGGQGRDGPQAALHLQPGTGGRTQPELLAQRQPRWAATVRPRQTRRSHVFTPPPPPPPSPFPSTPTPSSPLSSAPLAEMRSKPNQMEPCATSWASGSRCSGSPHTRCPAGRINCGGASVRLYTYLGEGGRVGVGSGELIELSAERTGREAGGKKGKCGEKESERERE